ncbi:hypothetical protein HYW83_03155 [Candidatus Peregrinibacteria bacterium]|nr:hypothetical protein [Candidatus Peregrinibacteria bacterium]
MPPDTTPDLQIVDPLADGELETAWFNGVSLEDLEAAGLSNAPRPGSNGKNHESVLESFAAPDAPAPDTQRHFNSRLLAALRLVIPPHAANSFAASLSSTAERQLQQEALAAQSNRNAIAAWFAQKRLGTGATTRPTDESCTKFNFFRPDGEYSGYSLRISPLPPFLMTYIRATKTGDQWETKTLFEDRPFENVRAALGR